ncbi:hypothetical protein [Paraburkholderia phytofirmans]|nr:hypothetical protein [Paraburkholderia phytofirmans]
MNIELNTIEQQIRPWIRAEPAVARQGWAYRSSDLRCIAFADLDFLLSYSDLMYPNNAVLLSTAGNHARWLRKA